MKIFIAGPPVTGKTTIHTPAIAQAHGITTIIHTDDYIEGYTWPEQPNAVIAALQPHQSYICEGIQVPRVLRKLLEQDPSFAPAAVYFYSKQYNPTKKQIETGKGIKTTFDSILPELKKRKVKINYT